MSVRLFSMSCARVARPCGRKTRAIVGSRKRSDSARADGVFLTKWELKRHWGRQMRMALVKSMLLWVAIALTLSGCGVNYHFNPGPRTWPAAANPPNK
jgi:hypothetical protein